MKVTCLHDKHVALGALMSPFGGFDMPIQYKGIVDEHNAVRNQVGVFDVSHMGEVEITGPEAEKFVNYIFTNDITDAPVGKIFYGMMLYPDGGTVDDLLVYKMGENDLFLVINAANIDKDVAWIMEHAKDFDVKVDHQSDIYGQLAVQGPDSETVLKSVLEIDATDLTFYTFKTMQYDGETIIVSRTGYTGEDGFEIYASHAAINKMWDLIFFIRHITHPYQIAIVFDSGFYLASDARRGIALRHRGTVGASGGTVGFHILWILGHFAAVRFRQHTPRKRRKYRSSQNARHRHLLSGVSALLQLTFKIAQLLLALRTSALAVALVLTLAGH